MLRKIRITLAIIFFVLVTLLFLDFTGTVHAYFGWMAKVQLIPAILALNIGAIIGLIVLALVFGRVYCSFICPMGVFQDVISHLNRKKNHFKYSPALTKLRLGVLIVFAVLLGGSFFCAGLNGITRLISPYSAYGRIASDLFAPIYKLGNNLLAYFAERADSYTFYSTDVWMKSISVPVIAIVTFVVIAILAWRNGRTWCNTICPVGTVLGYISKFSFFKIQIDADKCNKCGLCARNCKSSCIDFKEHTIDYSRCVACGNCIEKCKQSAIKYAPMSFAKSTQASTVQSSDAMVANSHAALAPIRVASPRTSSNARRNFLTGGALLLASSVIKAQEKTTDGGLADIDYKKEPDRMTPLTPPGSLSARNLTSHCTACQLCISVCPNQVLQPSNGMMTFMQPEMSYKRGYCRPECTKCSEVCPTGAIRLISKEDKTAIHIGHAIWIKENCIVNRDEVQCGNCSRKCPNGAITMIAIDPNNPDSLKFPSIDTDRCIGCGACEYVCPSRPLSAIYVEGHEAHRYESK